MNISSIDSVDHPHGSEQLPLEIRQRSRIIRSSLLISVAVVGMLALAMPVSLIIGEMLRHPEALGLFTERPLSTLLLIAGLLIAFTILFIPLRNGLSGFGVRRRLLITDDSVKIEDKGLFGQRRCRIPLSHFCGVTQHMRATLSGSRHEIILVHRDPEYDVLLQVSSAPPVMGADYYAGLLGVPELPATIFYGARREQPQPSAEVAMQSAAA